MFKVAIACVYCRIVCHRNMQLYKVGADAYTRHMKQQNSASKRNIHSRYEVTKMDKISATVENVSNIHIVRRNLGNAVCALLIGGVQVGTAKATYKTASQRTWEANLSAEINGVQFDMEQTGIFSAVRITEVFENAIKFKLTDGKEGKELPAPVVPATPAAEGAKTEEQAAPADEAPAAQEAVTVPPAEAKTKKGKGASRNLV